MAQGLGISLFAFGSAYCSLATARLSPRGKGGGRTPGQKPSQRGSIDWTFEAPRDGLQVTLTPAFQERCTKPKQ